MPYGIPAGVVHVDAEPVRRYLRAQLETGIPLSTLARFNGVRQGHLHHILNGNPKRGMPPTIHLTEDVADQIMSYRIRISDLPGDTWISTVGTIRRINALCRVGFPEPWMSNRLSWPRLAVRRTRDQLRIPVFRIQEMDRLYREVRLYDPREHGVSAHAYSIAVGRATRNGWAPPHCWDDDTIDVLDAIPEWTGHCGTAYGARLHYDYKILPVCDACKQARARDREEKKNRG